MTNYKNISKMEERKYNIIRQHIFSLIEYDRSEGKQIKHEDINAYIDRGLDCLGIQECDDEMRKRLVDDITYKYRITQIKPACVVDDYANVRDWYTNEEQKDNYFWSRYESYLVNSTGISPRSISLMNDETLPEIMNCLGNPKEVFEGKKLRRGLIIGDVQSGKTSTYIGLICKAADAGYKVVILLAGITESLRRQTQERVDEGVIGLTKNEKYPNGIPVGVGSDGKGFKATSFTSCMKDFVRNTDSITSSLHSHNSLVIFVIKKNVSILTRLLNWLRSQNIDAVKGYVDEPMLLIDDEADNASINTRADEVNPTKTNHLIRQICDLFKNATYVGFTATPFANVFIDPDSVDSMKRADLFPEHFIFALEPPSDYIGADKIFYENSPYYSNLCYITDIEEPDYTSKEYKETVQDNVEIFNHGAFYYKHKKEWDGILPASLDEAVLCFFLANAIRDLRGQSSAPRSMLVNMSRFVKVQRVIKTHIENLHDNTFNTIRYDFSDDDERNKGIPLYNQLKNLWDKHFSHVQDISFERATRRGVLINAIKNIKIVMVNGSKQSAQLNYSQNKSLRVIAVGGLALSRGLTLEGLMASYFYRNTAIFDVLMQMGRWFGYRKGYEHLFQIWTTQTSAQWYAEIAQSSQELKNDIKDMFEQRLTPKDFGIKVRDNNDELKITSYNKMRAASGINIRYSFYGNIYDTPYISYNVETNKFNLRRTKELAKELYNEGYKLRYANIVSNDDTKISDSSNSSSRFFENVPKNIIYEFLKGIKCSLVNMHFNVENILKFMDNPQTTGIDYWDIVFESGDSDKTYDIPHLDMIKCLRRTICEASRNVVQLSSRRRVLSLREGKFALDKTQIDLAESAWKQSREYTTKAQNVPLKAYFQYLPQRKPLLVIMYIEPNPENADENKKDTERIREFRNNLGSDSIVAFAVGFPGVRDAEEAIKYKVNKVYYEAMINDDEIEDSDEE